MLKQIMVLAILAVCAFEDIREQKIKMKILLAGAVSGVILLLFHLSDIREILAGVGVGLFVMLFSVVTKGKMGMGDAVLLMVTGLYLGGAQNLELFLTALLFSGLFGLYLLVIRKWAQTDAFAFVPFLLTAYVEMLVIRS